MEYSQPICRIPVNVLTSRLLASIGQGFDGVDDLTIKMSYSTVP